MNLRKAERLANTLIKEYCPGFTFKWDGSIRRFGCCYLTQKWISLSKKLTELNNEDQVKDTILHEIAHALEPHHHHDYHWKMRAISIGCSGSRLYNSDEVVVPPQKYTGTCPHCGRVFYRNRQKLLACGKCCKKYNFNKFDDRFVIKWSLTGGSI